MGINMHKQTKFWEWVKERFNPHYIKEIEEYVKDITDPYEFEYIKSILARRGYI